MARQSTSTPQPIIHIQYNQTHHTKPGAQNHVVKRPNKPRPQTKRNCSRRHTTNSHPRRQQRSKRHMVRTPIHVLCARPARIRNRKHLDMARLARTRIYHRQRRTRLRHRPGSTTEKRRKSRNTVQVLRTKPQSQQARPRQLHQRSTTRLVQPEMDRFHKRMELRRRKSHQIPNSTSTTHRLPRIPRPHHQRVHSTRRTPAKEIAGSRNRRRLRRISYTKQRTRKTHNGMRNRQNFRIPTSRRANRPRQRQNRIRRTKHIPSITSTPRMAHLHPKTNVLASRMLRRHRRRTRRKPSSRSRRPRMPRSIRPVPVMLAKASVQEMRLHKMTTHFSGKPSHPSVSSKLRQK